MKFRVFKEEDYYKIVICIYKISNDNKKNRVYLFKKADKRFSSNGVSPVYHDKLLVDLNIVDEYIEHPTDAMQQTVTYTDEIELDVIIHEALLGSFYL